MTQKILQNREKNFWFSKFKKFQKKLSIIILIFKNFKKRQKNPKNLMKKKKVSEKFKGVGKKLWNHFKMSQNS